MTRELGARRFRLERRVRRTLVAAAVAGGLITASATPAAAGGWWSTPQLEHQTLAIGESTTVSAGVMFASAEEADEVVGSGEYFAYLVRDIDEAGLHDAMSRSGPDGDWWTTPGEAIELGPLTLGRNMANLGNAKARFVVPDVEPGIYDVMLCDRGCSRALADVVPLRDLYVGDPATVRLLRETGLETQHLLDQLGTVEPRLDRLSEEIGTIGDDVDGLDLRLDGLSTSDHRLGASLATLEARIAEGASQDPVAPPWWTHAGWFLAGAALAGAWVSRRRGRAHDGHGDDRSHPDDRPAMPAGSDPGGAPSSPPELVTWETVRGSPVP